ncbi:hypothetical protein H6P81_001488 [Aristolochia fimbriata]|uniref:tRNA pseudouridine synthase n=1 Tax=Aristolochia fimbriata TaxID=158543 RepID=A0AAV7F712_ARIFI|nr:hypothetical protein H6P81_001488 [Aristolochia fimbriata]
MNSDETTLPTQMSKRWPPPESPRPSKLVKTECSSADPSNNHELMNSNPRVQRYLVAVEYIGTKFSGMQKQPGGRTIVGVLEDAFHKFVGQPVSVICSSRTDAGVHALCNVCHVDVERISKRKPGEVLPPHDAGVVRRALNHFLQKNEGDIAVTDVQSVPSDFHARYNAQERTYFYRILCGPQHMSVFEKERAWHVPEDLNVIAMKRACNILVGQHDFSSFRAAGCQANSPIRTLDELHICEVFSSTYFPSWTERQQMNMFSQESQVSSTNGVIKPCSETSCHNHGVHDDASVGECQEFGQRRRNRCYVVTARARSFLYHQIRLLVGVLKCAGTGELTLDDVEGILNAKTVTAAKPMAPACGLYLGHVKYDRP